MLFESLSLMNVSRHRLGHAHSSQLEHPARNPLTHIDRPPLRDSMNERDQQSMAYSLQVEEERKLDHTRRERERERHAVEQNERGKIGRDANQAHQYIVTTFKQFAEHANAVSHAHNLVAKRQLDISHVTHRILEVDSRIAGYRDTILNLRFRFVGLELSHPSHSKEVREVETLLQALSSLIQREQNDLTAALSERDNLYKARFELEVTPLPQFPTLSLVAPAAMAPEFVVSSPPTLQTVEVVPSETDDVIDGTAELSL